jgi:two-component system, NarL family, response regulator NreC
MIRVVIADDHNLVRHGIRALLEKQPDILVIGEADNGLEALKIIKHLMPDIAILDINMPILGGLEVIKELHDQNIQTNTMILSMYSDEALVAQSLRYGAKGYLLKSSVTDELIGAIQQIRSGDAYFSPMLLEELELESIHQLKRSITSYAIDTITRRELEIMRLIGEGKTNYQIARHLGISVKTVEKHRSNIMRKMDVQDLAGLIQKGIKLGFISLEK